nr:serine/threonine-protein kinase edr1 [Quercus suber]POE97324.1 serine/threonine-protein kinase edr1 [Quercus suber]
MDKEDTATNSEDAKFDKTSTLAAKILAKLQHIKGNGNYGKEDDGSIQENGAIDSSESKVTDNSNSFRDPKASTSHHCTLDTEAKRESPYRKNSSFAARREQSDFERSSVVTSSMECCECFGLSRPGDPIAKIRPPIQCEAVGTRRESIGSNGSSSSKGDNESNSIVDCEIRWEDLHLGEEIGQGFYAVVYHGLWNGSDVAIKVYFGNEYSEGTLLDFKKEIDIMKRLRHPNVLLFMGAAYTQERLSIVTEFLPRSDVFSFGVILWELMTESIPWNNLNGLQVVGVVGFMNRRLDLPEDLDPQVATIIKDCWHSDPEQRPSFKDIIQRMMGLLQRAAAAVSTQRSSKP